MQAPTGILKTAALLFVLIIATSCATSTTTRERLPPLQTVNHVSLDSYLGTWFEIASFPQSFQKDCHSTTANYSLREDGQIAVTNRCRLRDVDGPEKTAHGRARIVESQTNAKLEVSFFRPFWGDYWVIDLADDYSHAVVGHPGRDYLWILSRRPTMESARYEQILSRLRAQHYDTSRLVRTKHKPPA
jgi:apolipoprotein D and lipocalin family protein